jgi:hypothetical protein
MISLYREVAHPKQTQFPICSAAEGLEHALIEQKSPHFAASDPHARRMLEGEFSGTALKVSAAEHARYRDNLQDENHAGLTFVPLVRLSSQLLTREL